jgi:hypothetical protein
MKIQQGSIRGTINEFQQETKNSEVTKITKETLGDAKNVHVAGQFAENIKSEQSFSAIIRGNELQKTLAPSEKNHISAIQNNHTKIKALVDQLNSFVDQKKELIKKIIDVTAQIEGAEQDGNFQAAAKAQAQLQQLQSEVAKVDVAIKALLNEIEKAKQKEQDEQDRTKTQNDAEGRILDNLNKAADSIKTIQDATKLP